MTKKLEELFNLDSGEEPKAVEPPAENPVPVHEQVTNLDESFAAVAEITRGLPQVAELNDLQDEELDDLAKKAEDAYDNLMDLGMNVEVRYASRIFEVASSMLGHAITAKTNKIEKKLKAVDLQMKKYKIDKDNNEDPNDVINGAGYVVLDRNEMIKKLGGKA
jgi:hypothetical protein